MKTIILTGGGTAGHIYPLLAIEERIKKDYKFIFIGGNGMEKEIIKKSGIDFYEIPTVKLERKFTVKNLLIPFKLINSIYRAKKMLLKTKPSLILSKGGFVAVPVAIAGARLNIPVISHESDLTFGLANKIILKKCNLMCTTFAKTAENNDKCLFTGQPIRKNLLTGDKNKIWKMATFDSQKPNLLIVGGSLGAKFINDMVWNNLDNLTKKYNVVHIAGKQAQNNHHKAKNYLQVDYAENMGDFIAFADIVVSRAGSGAINEFLACRKPMLLIPLSKKCSRGDQIDNAKLFKKQNFCEMIEEENCDNAKFLYSIDKVYKNREIFKQNMKNSQPFDTCDKIIEQIKKMIK